MKELVCIVCPSGCTMALSGEGADVKVTGNKCKCGEAFAIAEMTNPTRTICSTVKTIFPAVLVIPVRVSAEIPKASIFDVMEQINRVIVDTPVRMGDVVIHNVLDLGVDVISTSGILKQV